MSIAPQLQRFVDDELALAPALVARVVAGTVQLLGPSNDAASGSERMEHADVMASLRQRAAHYEQAFVDSLKQQVKDELRQRDDPSAEGPASPLDSLTLMDESRVEVDIEISRAMQLIDSTAEWELRELQMFTSTLVGQTHVTPESNPFRPLVYATALWDAACVVVGSQAHRALILRTSAGVAAGLLKNACAAASSRLEAQGVEPGVYRTVVLPSGAALGRPAPDPARAGALSALLASMPQPPAAGSRGDGASRDGRIATSRSDRAGRRSPELEQALMRLDELLRHPPMETSRGGTASPGHRFEQHRSALVASASEPFERQVIELVTRLFESMLADSALPAPLRPVLARMQVAVLRLCLTDASALESFEHPVWRLLDRMGQASVGYSRIEDPRLSGFLTFSAAVAEEMAGAAMPDAALFRRGLNRVDVFLSEQLQGQVRAAGAAVEGLRLAERREVLQQHLTQRLTDSMASMRTTPAIRRFVTGTWAQVIAAAMLGHGEQSEQAMATLKTVDDLLWSLKIPDHPQSRQRLIALLPGLLQRLRAGMEAVRLPATERHVVVDELMTIHTDALRPGTRAAPGSPTSEEIVQRMRDEVVAETPPARTFSDSVIDLSSMETVPAEHLPTGADRADDDPGKRVESMRVGERHRIFLERRWSRVQLLWRSDRSLFFLFAGESASRTHSITRRALERLSSAGLVQPIEAKPLVQRAVDRMMRELSARGSA